MIDTDVGGACFCDIDYDYDPRAFYHKTTPKARKAHRCYECNRQIEIGEKYELVRAKYFDHWDTYRTHLACAGIRRDFCCNVHGSVDPTFEDLYGFNPWELPEDDED